MWRLLDVVYLMCLALCIVSICCGRADGFLLAFLLLLINNLD